MLLGRLGDSEESVRVGARRELLKRGPEIVPQLSRINGETETVLGHYEVIASAEFGKAQEAVDFFAANEGLAFIVLAATADQVGTACIGAKALSRFGTDELRPFVPELLARLKETFLLLSGGEDNVVREILKWALFSSLSRCIEQPYPSERDFRKMRTLDSRAKVDQVIEKTEHWLKSRRLDRGGG